MENEYVEIYIDDVLNAMGQIDDQSIDLIITSPPYFNQKDYYSSKVYRLFVNLKNKLLNFYK